MGVEGTAIMAIILDYVVPLWKYSSHIVRYSSYTRIADAYGSPLREFPRESHRLEGHHNYRFRSEMDTRRIQESILSYGLSHGLLHGETIEGKPYFTHMAVSLLPYPLSNDLKRQGENLNALFGELVTCICSDPEWLFDQLKDVTDDFTKQLIVIAKNAIQSPFYQPIVLGIMRSDYLLEEKECANQLMPLQVELNTISCSFIGVEETLTKTHQYAIQSNSDQLKAISESLSVNEDVLNNYVQESEYNSTCRSSCSSLYAAVTMYNEMYHRNAHTILLVCQDHEMNSIDQFTLTSSLFTLYGIRTVYQSHQALQSSMQIQHGVLFVQKEEIAVVYFRSGYTPADYPSRGEWEIRAALENCLAIKCPNVLLQLAGCKKIQQQLAAPGGVEHFLSEPQSRLLRECFVEMHPAEQLVEEEDLRTAYSAVLQNPFNYVLKPQREGGGFNIWGADIVDVLQRKDHTELASLIVMKRIAGKEHVAYHLRDNDVLRLPSISEIGFYSGVLFNSKSRKICSNSNIGVLVRTKTSDSFEGGVCAGFAVLNSPLFYD